MRESTSRPGRCDHEFRRRAPAAGEPIAASGTTRARWNPAGAPFQARHGGDTTETDKDRQGRSPPGLMAPAAGTPRKTLVRPHQWHSIRTRKKQGGAVELSSTAPLHETPAARRRYDCITAARSHAPRRSTGRRAGCPAHRFVPTCGLPACRTPPAGAHRRTCCQRPGPGRSTRSRCPGGRACGRRGIRCPST